MTLNMLNVLNRATFTLGTAASSSQSILNQYQTRTVVPAVRMATPDDIDAYKSIVQPTVISNVMLEESPESNDFDSASERLRNYIGVGPDTFTEAENDKDPLPPAGYRMTKAQRDIAFKRKFRDTINDFKLSKNSKLDAIAQRQSDIEMLKGVLAAKRSGSVENFERAVAPVYHIYARIEEAVAAEFREYASATEYAADIDRIKVEQLAMAKELTQRQRDLEMKLKELTDLEEQASNSEKLRTEWDAASSEARELGQRVGSLTRECEDARAKLSAAVLDLEAVRGQKSQQGVADKSATEEEGDAVATAQFATERARLESRLKELRTGNDAKKERVATLKKTINESEIGGGGGPQSQPQPQQSELPLSQEEEVQIAALRSRHQSVTALVAQTQLQNESDSSAVRSLTALAAAFLNAMKQDGSLQTTVLATVVAKRGCSILLDELDASLKANQRVPPTTPGRSTAAPQPSVEEAVYGLVNRGLLRVEMADDGTRRRVVWSGVLG